MQKQLQKAIELSKKTGDRIIVIDNANNNNAFVVMSLDEYEKIMLGKSEIKGLTEEELLDKINRDIAVWKNENNIKGWSEAGMSQNNNHLKDDFYFDEEDDYYEDEEDYSDDEDMYYYEEDDDDEDDYCEEGLKFGRDFDTREEDNFSSRNHWGISNNVKEKAEEIF